MKRQSTLLTNARRLIGSTASILIVLSCFCVETFSTEVLPDEEKRKKVVEMYEDYKRSSFPDIEDIAPQEALKLLDQGNVLFVDIRSHNEQEISTLPNAITEEEFRQDPNAYADRVIIGYCTISYRSGLFAREFKEKGIRVLNLKGGLLGWVHEGGKVYDRKGETKLVHVYGKKWDLAPNEYETRFFKVPLLKL